MRCEKLYWELIVQLKAYNQLDLVIIESRCNSYDRPTDGVQGHCEALLSANALILLSPWVLQTKDCLRYNSCVKVVVCPYRHLVWISRTHVPGRYLQIHKLASAVDVPFPTSQQSTVSKQVDFFNATNTHVSINWMIPIAMRFLCMNYHQRE